ncbi:MAG TPA: cytochrome c biogenesis protein CcdA [Synechococcales cyanobacterium M55_K2018_004]|nr:cytochrome c biogenesis protein CcdA [Synechococcales cyanobacterium M55_K2018_004]
MPQPPVMGDRTRQRQRLVLGVALCLGGLAGAIAANQVPFVQLLQPLQALIVQIEQPYQQWMDQQVGQNIWVLLPLAFVGGLIASVSPCILCLLPINLGYIGTREIASKREAFSKASLFVLGVITTLSLVGLFSSFAAAIALHYRGYINILVGLLVMLMGFNLLNILRIPLPQISLDLPKAGPYGFGLTFALITSPCASPVMFSVLALAAGTGSQAFSVLTMVSYALGYTMVIFLASLFTGLAKQTRSLLPYSGLIFRAGGMALLVVGGYYIINGLHWLLALLNQSH